MLICFSRNSPNSPGRCSLGEKKVHNLALTPDFIYVYYNVSQKYEASMASVVKERIKETG